MPLFSCGPHSSQCTGLVIPCQLPLLVLLIHSTESSCLLLCYSDTGPFISVHNLCKENIAMDLVIILITHGPFSIWSEWTKKGNLITPGHQGLSTNNNFLSLLSISMFSVVGILYFMNKQHNPTLWDHVAIVKCLPHWVGKVFLSQ